MEVQWNGREYDLEPVKEGFWPEGKNMLVGHPEAQIRRVVCIVPRLNTGGYPVKCEGAIEAMRAFEIPKPVTQEVPRPLEEQIEILRTKWIKVVGGYTGIYFNGCSSFCGDSDLRSNGVRVDESFFWADSHDSTEWHKVTTKRVEVVE